MGGRKDNKVKETPHEIAAAEVAGKYWDIYQNDLKGFEDTFIQRVDNFNSGSNMAKTKEAVDLGYNKAFSESRGTVADNLTASGVDPTSGKFKAAMSDMSTEQSIAQNDTVNRAQAAEQDKYVAGLADVVSLGTGQQANALRGMGDVANLSLRQAQTDAYNDFNRRSGNLQLAGAAAGIGLRSYGAMKKPDTEFELTTDGVSTRRNGQDTYDHRHNPGGKMHA